MQKDFYLLHTCLDRGQADDVHPIPKHRSYDSPRTEKSRDCSLLHLARYPFLFFCKRSSRFLWQQRDLEERNISENNNGLPGYVRTRTSGRISRNSFDD